MLNTISTSFLPSHGHWIPSSQQIGANATCAQSRAPISKEKDHKFTFFLTLCHEKDFFSSSFCRTRQNAVLKSGKKPRWILFVSRAISLNLICVKRLSVTWSFWRRSTEKVDLQGSQQRNEWARKLHHSSLLPPILFIYLFFFFGQWTNSRFSGHTHTRTHTHKQTNIRTQTFAFLKHISGKINWCWLSLRRTVQKPADKSTGLLSPPSSLSASE